MKFSSLQDRVVVITGASSGIGRLTTERMLRQGARVVMAARSEDDMKHHVRQLGVDKNRVLVVSCDVSNYKQVQNLARKAVRHFGKIDVWVNNAGINIYGTVDQLDVTDIRQLIDVNLMGEVHGVKAVLPYFKKQKYGNIINMSSIFGKVAAPLESAYNASKFGIIGFSKALREELMMRHPKIDVSVILPAGMDTPMFDHAKTKTGLKPKPIPPVYDPVMVADAIVETAMNPKPEVTVGGAGKVFELAERFMPRGLERIMSFIGFPGQMTAQPKIWGRSNLFEPSGPHRAYGSRERKPEAIHINGGRFAPSDIDAEEHGMAPLKAIAAFTGMNKVANIAKQVFEPGNGREDHDQDIARQTIKHAEYERSAIEKGSPIRSVLGAAIPLLLIYGAVTYKPRETSETSFCDAVMQ